MTTNREIADGIESLIGDWIVKLRKLEPATVNVKPAPDRWSVAELIGHLIDSACNNHQRFVRAQFCDELTFPKYEQNEWVSAADYGNCNWTSLVDLWYHYNRLVAHIIRNLPESKVSIPCTITPYETVTLGDLVTDYLEHLNHHFMILDERLAAETK